jgi:uncharacterized protein (TIGR03067 family)
MAQDLDNLQGTWSMISLELDGQPMSGGGAQIEVRGDRFTTIAMGAIYEGTVVLHEDTSPRSFDLRFDDGPEKGSTSLGIYRLDGDIWTICFTTRGGERPTKFASPSGAGVALETLQRQTPRHAQAAPVPMGEAGLVIGEFSYDMVGQWKPLSVVRDGQPVDNALLKIGRRIATVDRVTVKFGAQVVVQAVFTVDRSPRPMTIDYFLDDGQKQLGIWQLEGDRLTTCMGAPGQPRPNGFTSVPGDGRTLAVWIPAGS